MLERRKPLLPARETQSASTHKDGALGVNRHRTAMTVLGSTVAGCAILGTVLSTGPSIGLAADAQAAQVSTAKAHPDPAVHPGMSAAQIALRQADAKVPLVTPPPPPVPAAPPAPKPAAKKAPAATPAPKKTAPPTTNNSYSGDSAYQLAEQIVPSGQFGCFDWIVTRESGWNVTATNPSSGAYGLGQALPGDKMASAGPDWQTNPVTQIDWTLSYMDSRYGSPCAAQSFWESHGWY